MHTRFRRGLIAATITTATVLGLSGTATASEPPLGSIPSVDGTIAQPDYRQPTPLDLTPYREGRIAWLPLPGNDRAMQETPDGRWVDLLVLHRDGHYGEHPVVTVYPFWEDTAALGALNPQEYVARLQDQINQLASRGGVDTQFVQELLQALPDGIRGAITFPAAR